MCSILTQYFDMLEEVGGSSRSSTILLPHSPGGLDSIMDQLRNAMITGEAAARQED